MIKRSSWVAVVGGVLTISFSNGTGAVITPTVVPRFGEARVR